MPEESTVNYPLAGLEVTDYDIVEFDNAATQAEIIYSDQAGLSYKRFVYIPRTDTGEVDDPYFQEILYSHLLAINEKRKVGAITFTDFAEVVEESEESNE